MFKIERLGGVGRYGMRAVKRGLTFVTGGEGTATYKRRACLRCMPVANVPGAQPPPSLQR